MSDHEFEKQVRQKLNNLKLTPTPEAWENIEEKLRGRRRRTPLVWLPLLLAGMLAGGYFMLNLHPLPSPGTNNSTAIKTSNGQHLPVLNNTNNYNNNTSSKPGNTPVFGYRNISLVSKSKKIQPMLNDRIEATEAPETSTGDAANRSATLTQPEADGPITGTSNTGEADKEHGKKPVGLMQPTDKATAAATAPKPPALKTTVSKWSYAINFYSGISAENERGIYGFNKPKVEDIAYTTSFAATVANYAPVYKPSIISPGFTFSMGSEVKREFSKRFSISAGLNYTQFNTRSQVGQKINSSNVVNNGVRGYLYVQSYYMLDQNDNREYKNKYHFIELPITLHTRINNSSSLPLYWDAGFIVSRLINSTSLHFDGSTGVYYKNDRLLNQTQAAVTTGFSFAVFNKRAHPLWIGPSARSNISSILKKDISANKHFVTLGLDLKFFLKK